MDQLNREAVIIAHMLARLLDEKYRANRRLYEGRLTVLIVLGVVLLTIWAMTSST